jgi:hypothetical protein
LGLGRQTQVQLLPKRDYISEIWGKILVVNFLEHYNHEGKLVDINIRVTRPLTKGEKVGPIDVHGGCHKKRDESGAE